MKICRFARMVGRYADNELGPEERAAFEAHLRECGDCSAGLEAALSLKGEYRALDRQEAPADFTGRVMAAVEKLETQNVLVLKRAERVSFRLAPVFAAVALALVVWLGVSIHNFNVDMDIENLLTGNGTYITGDIFEGIRG